MKLENDKKYLVKTPTGEFEGYYFNTEIYGLGMKCELCGRDAGTHLFTIFIDEPDADFNNWVGQVYIGKSCIKKCEITEVE